MSIATTQNEIDYPESDGKPIGETDLHRDWTVRLLEIFRQRYARQKVYAASDLLLYYEAGTPTKFVVPDCFVVLDCSPHRRRTFLTWQEEHTPDVLFEVTSRSTSSSDLVDKPVIYERIGVQEYFLFDPSAEYLTPPLRGFRTVDGYLRDIPSTDGRLTCETLGVDLYCRGKDLVVVDRETGVEQLPKADFEEREKEQERAGRLAAEARVRELEEELRRSRNENG